MGQARLRHARDNGRNKLSKERVVVRDLPEMGVGLWWADRARSYNSMPRKVQLITEMRAEGKVETIGSGGDCVKLKAKGLCRKDAKSQSQWIVAIKEYRPSITKSSHF